MSRLSPGCEFSEENWLTERFEVLYGNCDTKHNIGSIYQVRINSNEW